MNHPKTLKNGYYKKLRCHFPILLPKLIWRCVSICCYIYCLYIVWTPYSFERRYVRGILTVPNSIELESVQAAAVDCKVAATPPAAWIVPTPETTVPNVVIATGINMLAPTPATNTLPPMIVAFFTILIS